VLEALRIRDLGVIGDVAVEFGPGLNAVTGETGAGKTMVVTGLNLLFGGRADVSRVRAGAELASVEGRLQLATGSPAAIRALDAGGEVEDGELLLRRTVTTAGRSRAHVGGAATPVAVLGELGEDIVVVHGQADQMRLSRPGAQRLALDRYAGIEVTAYRRAFEAWRAAETALAERLRDRGALAREADLLTFGLGEIDTIAPQPGENVELAERAARLAAADDLRLAARTAHDVLLGDTDDPASDALDVRTSLTLAQRRLDQSAPSDPALQALSERMTDLIVATDDLGAELAAYGEGLDADPAELARLEARRGELNTLIRKYADAGTDLTGVLEWAERARTRLAQIDTSDDALAELTGRRDAAENEATVLARELTFTRTTAAAALAGAVTDELHGLAMADARLHVIVRNRVAVSGGPALGAGRERSGAGPDGVDEVEFQLQPHADASPIALQKGASGGELSRVMLALEVVLAGTDPVPVMVFDEVDAGVGGRAAVEVGRRLARLGRQHQVIVVTHLAQVAAFADRHLAVRTATEDPGVAAAADPGRTVSEVVVVEGDDRVAELARMLAGRDTDTAREHAAELLRDASVGLGQIVDGAPRRGRRGGHS
jgi:DNA repair protein RecN (Recombination protein N)